MLNSSNRQIFVLNKKGDKMGVLDVPEMFYLDTELNWCKNRVDQSDLDGVAFIIDWEKRQITSIRYAK